MEEQNPYKLRLLQKTQKKGNKTNFKNPKSIPKNPRDLPSMVANSVVSGKSPYKL